MIVIKAVATKKTLIMKNATDKLFTDTTRF